MCQILHRRKKHWLTILAQGFPEWATDQSIEDFTRNLNVEKWKLFTIINSKGRKKALFYLTDRSKAEKIQGSTFWFGGSKIDLGKLSEGPKFMVNGKLDVIPKFEFKAQTTVVAPEASNSKFCKLQAQIDNLHLIIKKLEEKFIIDHDIVPPKRPRNIWNYKEHAMKSLGIAPKETSKKIHEEKALEGQP